LIDGNVVSSGYFEGVGARLVAGQSFMPAPAPDDCRVAVINSVAADRYFAGAAIGGAVIDGAGRRTDIVGVIQSPRLGRFDRRAEPAIYFHMDQAAARRMTLMLDVGGSDDTTLFALQGRLRRVPGGASQPAVVRLDEHLGRTALAPLRIALLLVRAAAALAIVLAIAGTYGALAEVVRRRRREIGVRLALGARRLRVIGLVLVHACILGCVGVVFGTSAVIAARRAFLGEMPVAWFVWLAGPVVMLSAIAVASILPVRLALKVDPLDVLRDD
jgi:putative ABC transport system permease protein